MAQSYINVNTVQVEAETKLMTVMKQRMNATDDEIQLFGGRLLSEWKKY